MFINEYESWQQELILKGVTPMRHKHYKDYVREAMNRRDGDIAYYLELNPKKETWFEYFSTKLFKDEQ